MIFRIFKSSTGIQPVILLITMVLLWLPAFTSAHAMPLPEMITPAYGFVYNLLSDMPVWYTTIAMLLVVGGAILLNTLLSDFGITPKNSYLVAFVYMVFMSCSTNYLTLHPVLIINIFVILLLRMVFIANQKEDSLKEILGAGFLAALCSLFVFKSAGLFIAVWLFLIILRIYSWRQWAANLFGFISVYLYVFTWYLFTDKLMAKFELYRTVIHSIKLVHPALHLSVYEYILLALILLLLLISVVNFLFNVNEKLINIRRISLVLLWLLIISLVSALFYISNPVFDFSFLLLPISIMVALYYSNLKKSLFGEIIFILLIVSIILCRV